MDNLGPKISGRKVRLRYLIYSRESVRLHTISTYSFRSKEKKRKRKVNEKLTWSLCTYIDLIKSVGFVV